MTDTEYEMSPSAGNMPRAIVIMGVTGSGKTVVGEALARKLGWVFIEGDDLHPPENIARMGKGMPLTDSHRQGWLETVGAQILANVSAGHSAIAACSALKFAYREKLREAAGGLLFVHLELEPHLARLRVARRKGHFMPASLVDSQFAALEPPSPREQAISVDAQLPVSSIVAEIIHYLEKAKPAGNDNRSS